MKTALACMACFTVCCLAGMHASADFVTVNDLNVIVTGVRSDSPTEGTDSVVITSSYNISGGNTVAAIYEGSLAGAGAPGAVWNQLQPVISDQTITSSSLYGPNTSIFSPSLGTGNIIAVGSYKYTQSTTGADTNHGLLYQGTVTGAGTWTQIDATPLATGGETVENTIAHSTMGGLVVGNYDTGAAGKAFIYNIALGNTGWTDLNPAGSLSVSAYGIWQNGGSTSSSFTIAGGFSDFNDAGVDEGYLVDYDSANGTFSNYKTYNFDNQPITTLTSHFNGITATADGFNLTGFYTTTGGVEDGFLASVTIEPDGSFSDATWTSISFPGAPLTTGNTVIGDDVLGFAPTDDSTSFIVAVPEPPGWSLLLLCACLLPLFVRLRSGSSGSIA